MPLSAFALPMLAPSYMSAADGAGADGDTVAVSTTTTSSTRAVGPPSSAGAPGDMNRYGPLGPPSNLNGPTAGTASQLGIPDVVLAAYRNAARMASSIAPGCRMDWAVLAGIGRVESRHGMHFGVDSVIDTQGTVRKPIIGSALNGVGAVSSIPDTDNGQWDGDRTWDRAVGPMQFIPSSWRRFGKDGNDDGVRDPHNAFDAALSAAAHLCGTAAVDLTDDEHLDRSLYGYNRSNDYVETVRRWIGIYRSTDPSNVPRMAVRNTPAVGGPVSPFPAPDERIAGAFEAATPLSSSKLATASASSASKKAGTSVASGGTKVADSTNTKSSSTSKKKSTTSDKKATSDSNGAKKKSQAKTKSEATEKPSDSSSAKPKKPKASPKPEPSPSSPAPPPSAPASPDPASEPEPAPAAEPELEPAPAPEPEPAPEPAPAPEPEPEPEPSGGGGASDAPTADPVDYTGKRPDMTYERGAAADWPKACRPAALWADVAAAAAADHVTIATGVAAPDKDAGDRLTVTWRTKRETVWRVTTHDCETGELVARATSV